MKKGLTALCCAALLSTVGVGSCLADTAALSADVRHAATFWHTDRARLLDSNELRQKLAGLTDDLGNPSGQSGASAKSPEETADTIVQLILAEMKDDRGVHLETALSALGAMAGFSCQLTVRGFAKARKVPLDKAFVILKTKDGETYYGGGVLNEGLVSNVKGRHSVWSFVTGAVEQLGKPLPDLAEIFRHTAADIGTDRFGVPHVAPEHMPHQTNQELLWKYWNITRNIMVLDEQPSVFSSLILADAAQKLIVLGRDNIDPTLAAQLVMEAAVSMSKISPDHVYAASLK